MTNSDDFAFSPVKYHDDGQIFFDSKSYNNVPKGMTDTPYI